MARPLTCYHPDCNLAATHQGRRLGISYCEPHAIEAEREEQRRLEERRPAEEAASRRWAFQREHFRRVEFGETYAWACHACGCLVEEFTLHMSHTHGVKFDD